LTGGCWITSHVINDLPGTHRERYSQFYRSACLVANCRLDLEISPQARHLWGRWFEGLGDWTEVRKVATSGNDQKTIGPDSPTVLTLCAPLHYPHLPTKEQA